MIPDEDPRTRQYLLARFWDSALGFWRRGGDRPAWTLTVLLTAVALASLALQYRLNVWHRGMFDALDRRDAGGGAGPGRGVRPPDRRRSWAWPWRPPT